MVYWGMKHVLTIAGHDLTSGAGITKDLEIFFGLGLHAFSIPTSFVIQGSRGVRSVVPTPARPLAAMLRTVTDEISLDGIKVGVLGGTLQVKKVAQFLGKYREKPIVLDPVTRSKNGQALLSGDGLKQCVEKIFPLVFLLTPNLDEASQLVGEKITGLKEMKQAVKTLSAMGPKHILLKGGHLPGEPIDLLYDGNDFVTYKKTRLNREVHGTGCALSSLMLAFVVLGYPLREAFLKAEKAMEDLLKSSYRLTPDGYWYTALSHIAAVKDMRWSVLPSS
jgi:hydroxymethylpyrimidine kinase/phosphomethylpyrimidine kinase